MKGSFQFYVAGADFLFSKLKVPKKPGLSNLSQTQIRECCLFNPDHTQLRVDLDSEENQKLILKNFEKVAFFDLLTGNNDHHFRNLLLLDEKLVLIDNANSFPWCHDKDRPQNRTRPLHWFKWSTLPHAQKPFSKELTDWIKKLDFDQIEQRLSQVLVSSDTPSSQENYKGKINTLKDRFITIKQRAIEGATMREIAEEILELTATVLHNSLEQQSKNNS